MPRKRVAEPVEQDSDPEHPISGYRRVPRPLSNRGKWHLDNEVRELIAASEAGEAVEYDIANPQELHKIHMNMRHVAKMKGYRFSFRKEAEPIAFHLSVQLPEGRGGEDPGMGGAHQAAPWEG